MVQGTLAIAAAIIAEASLSYLGLGQQPLAPWLISGLGDLPCRAVVQSRG
jgi:hypothetical protein